jgi:hypothetical protein
MKSEMYHSIIEKGEFGEFANFFLKYLNGSSTFDEAFLRASNTYRRLFKKIPYQNCQSFLSDFYKSQYES